MLIEEKLNQIWKFSIYKQALNSIIGSMISSSFERLPLWILN